MLVDCLFKFVKKHEKSGCVFRRFENTTLNVLVSLTVNFKFQNGFTYLNSSLKRASKVSVISKTCNYMDALTLPE